MSVKFLAQELNAMTQARDRTRAARPGDERTNHEATTAPTIKAAKRPWSLELPTKINNKVTPAWAVVSSENIKISRQIITSQVTKLFCQVLTAYKFMF